MFCFAVPEAEEALLDCRSGRSKDNEVEGWTAYQLPQSSEAITGFEILTLAVDDIVSLLSSRGHHKFGIRCSNNDDVILLQETHLRRSTAGCSGIRVRGVSLLLFSLYLKNSTPLHCHPNAEILARLVAAIKHHSGQWLVAGDFNLSPQEVADTALVNELGGQLHTVGFPTTHGGSELDFAITSIAIAGLISVSLDWSAPHRPHASLCIEFLIPGKQDKTLRLVDFPVNEAVTEPCLAASKPGPIPIKIVNLDFSDDPFSQKLSSIARCCQDAMYPGEQLPRGSSVFFTKEARTPGQRYRTKPKAPDKVAVKSVKVFTMLQANLSQEQLTLSSSKSAFVCTDKDTQKSAGSG